MHNLHNFFPEIKPFYLRFEENQTIRLATAIGNGLATSLRAVEQKKAYFAQLFEIISNEEIEAVINAWAVVVMLEDTIPVPQKIEAFRALFNDEKLDNEILNTVIRFLIITRRISEDLFDFIVPEIKHSPKIKAEIKELI